MATSVILVTSMAKAINIIMAANIVMATSTCHAVTLSWWQQFPSRQYSQKQHSLGVIDLGNAVMWNTRYSGHSAALGVYWYVRTYVYVGMYVYLIFMVSNCFTMLRLWEKAGCYVLLLLVSGPCGMASCPPSLYPFTLTHSTRGTRKMNETHIICSAVIVHIMH